MCRDGSDGAAYFTFSNPTVFDIENQGDITGMFLCDAEGELSSVDVKAKFVNGKPEAIEAKYVALWRTLGLTPLTMVFLVISQH